MHLRGDGTLRPLRVPNPEVHSFPTSGSTRLRVAGAFPRRYPHLWIGLVEAGGLVDGYRGCALAERVGADRFGRALAGSETLDRGNPGGSHLR